MKKENEKPVVNYMETRTAICPITFVENEVKPTNDVNQIFLLPYDTTSMINHELEKKYKRIINDPSFDREESTSFANQFAEKATNNLKYTIFNYFSMNMDDLLRSFFYKVIDDLSRVSDDDKYKMRVGYFKVFATENEYRCTSYLVNTIQDIRETCSRLIFTSDLSQYYDINLAVFSRIAQTLFNNSVYLFNILFSDMVCNYINNSYDETDDVIGATLVKNMVEGDDIPDTIKEKAAANISRNLRYNIISTHVREIIDNNFPNLYGGFMNIASNAAKLADVDFINSFHQIPEMIEK